MKVDDLIAATGARAVHVPDGLTLSGYSTLRNAGPSDAALVSSKQWVEAARESRAALLLVTPEVARIFEDESYAGSYLILSQPWKAVLYLLQFLYPENYAYPAGIHSTAVVDSSAVIDPTVSIAPLCVVGPNVVIGARTRLAPGVVIEKDCSIGEDCYLHARTVLEPGTLLGNRVTIQAGAVIGSDGFKYEIIDGRRTKIPQVGIVTVDDDAEIGANACIDRASLTRTTIGSNTKIDNLVQIGHNVTVGNDTVIVAQVGVAGSTSIGNQVIIAGQAGLADNISIGDGAILLARAAVFRDVAPKTVLLGEPARPRKEYLRIIATQDKLPDMALELRRLQKQVEELEKKLAEFQNLGTHCDSSEDSRP
jgi:UDP-3-O-[3-hydroxymyristoyl] glucosamine N-acyltransferase